MTFLGSGNFPAIATTPIAKPTSMTIKAAAGTTLPGRKDTLTATLKSGRTLVAGATVKLETRTPGAKKWRLVTTRVTGAKGGAVFSVVPGTRKGQKEQYEIVFPGNSKYKASSSAIITLTVA